MVKLYRKAHPLIKILNLSLVDLPSPTTISLMWNFGSLLGICLGVQIVTGVFLSLHYCSDMLLAFSSTCHISRDVQYGWVMRNIHTNGASLFFVCIYCHIGRGLYFMSYSLTHTWIVGVMIFLLTMMTAFMGYVLPWGQMSFWAATVITNLLSTVPYVGEMLVQWIWGGFAVDKATLIRFFSFHFLLPFIVAALAVIHLLFLHQTGSTNPLGLNSDVDKVPFHSYFSLKDMMGLLVLFTPLIYIIYISPNIMTDPENFIMSNPLVTPLHIQPEWYFLFAYAILRSIPNKLGGVIALIMSILILMLLPIMFNSKMKSLQFSPFSQLVFWSFIGVMFLLTWIGARPVEDPYIWVGQVLTMLYFLYFITLPFLNFN